jgi:hypothetical protein
VSAGVHASRLSPGGLQRLPRNHRHRTLSVRECRLRHTSTPTPQPARGSPPLHCPRHQRCRCCRCCCHPELQVSYCEGGRAPRCKPETSTRQDRYSQRRPSAGHSAVMTGDGPSTRLDTGWDAVGWDARALAVHHHCEMLRQLLELICSARHSERRCTVRACSVAARAALAGVHLLRTGSAAARSAAAVAVAPRGSNRRSAAGSGCTCIVCGGPAHRSAEWLSAAPTRTGCRAPSPVVRFWPYRYTTVEFRLSFL